MPVAVRGAGIVVSFGLAALAICLVVFSTQKKLIELGVIAGLWSALLGAVAIYGVRHARGATSSGGELEVRDRRGLETLRDAEDRRAYERQLQELVERELHKIQSRMNDQLDHLRDEVSELRGELVEKVGGQLRLERIETTRVIGSDIEALQHEVRRLAVERDPFAELDAAEFAGGYRRDEVRTVKRPRFEPPAAAPEPVPPVQPVQLVPPVQPVASVPPVQLVAPVASVQPAAAAGPPATPPPPVPPVREPDVDPFLGMPRLTRFEDDGGPGPSATDTGELPAVGSEARDHERSRHHAAADDPPAAPTAAVPVVGRRRRAPGERNEVLERVLGR